MIQIPPLNLTQQAQPPQPQPQPSDISTVVNFPYQILNFWEEMLKKITDRTIRCTHGDMLGLLRQQLNDLYIKKNNELYKLSIGFMCDFIAKNTKKYTIRQQGTRTSQIQF